MKGVLNFTLILRLVLWCVMVCTPGLLGQIHHRYGLNSAERNRGCWYASLDLRGGGRSRHEYTEQRIVSYPTCEGLPRESHLHPLFLLRIQCLFLEQALRSLGLNTSYGTGALPTHASLLCGLQVVSCPNKIEENWKGRGMSSDFRNFPFGCVSISCLSRSPNLFAEATAGKEGFSTTGADVPSQISELQALLTSRVPRAGPAGQPSPPP